MHRLCTLVLAALMLLATEAFAQQRRIATYPYAQSFGFVTPGTTAFPTGNVDGGEFTLDALTTGWTASPASPGLNDNNGIGGGIRIQTADNSTSQGFIFYGDFAGRCADSLAIDWTKVANPPDGSRMNQLRIATNNGSGSVFTDIPTANVAGGAWPTFTNASTAQSGTLRVKLPALLNGSTDVRIRIYSVSTSGTGNYPGVLVDNLTVTALGAPSAGGIDSIGNLGGASQTLFLNPSAESDSILVLRSVIGSPTFVPVDNMTYPVGTPVNANDLVVYSGPANVTRIPFGGLQQGVTYYYAVYGKRSCNRRYSASPLMASGTTLAACSGTAANITGVTLRSRGQDSVRLNFTSGNRTDSVLVIRRLRNAPTAIPATGVRYTVGQGLNANDTVAYFGPVAFPMTIRNLQADSTYVFALYGVQSCNLAYSAVAPTVTARTYCTGTVANVPGFSVRYTTSNSASLAIGSTAGATQYVIFSAGPDIMVPSPANGTAYTVGDVVGDDTVRYIGTSTQPLISGLASSTTYRFWGYGYRECNLSYSILGGAADATTLAPCSVGTPSAVDSIFASRNVRDTLTIGWRRVAGASEYLMVARIDSTPNMGPSNGSFYMRNDVLGGGFVLGRTTDSTLRLTGLPANTAYFIRVYPIRNCDLTYGSAPLVFPVATRGTATLQRFAIRAGSVDTIRFAGTIIEFIEPVTADGSLLIARNSGPLSYTGLPLFRANRPPINNLSVDRWWSFSTVGLGDFLYNAKFDITGVPGIQDTSDLAMVYRKQMNLPWEDFARDGYQVDSTGRYIGVARRSLFPSEYAIGANVGLNTLPVKLLSFDGFSRNGRNTLRWRTASEKENAGFRLYRSRIDAGGEDGFTFVADYTTSGQMRGAGTSNLSHSYSFVDASDLLSAGGRYLYKLEEVSLDGASNEIGRLALALTPETAAGMASFQIAPNPVVGSSMNIAYSVAEDGPVAITLVNMVGESVMTLVNESQVQAGVHTLTVDLGGMAAGTYFCQVRAGGTVVSYPVTIVR